MSMITLHKALKLKNRLIQRLNECSNLIRSNNSVIVGNERDCDVKEQLERRRSLSTRLVQLKINIEKASMPIRDKILLQSEMKDEIKLLKQLDCTQGKKSERWGSGPAEEYEACISDAVRRQMTSGLEDQIDALQDEINSFNISTMVEEV
mgnify:CR=1 FL=1